MRSNKALYFFLVTLLILSSLLIVTIANATAPATILGIKYLDVNRNGVFDNGDSPLAGWTINLTNSSGTVGSVVTNASGFFLFSNLSAGRYNVTEVLQPGYTNTTLMTYTMSISAGKTLNITSLVGGFGNIQLAKIIGLKYLDTKGNKTFDKGDTPLAGWTINLSNASGLVGSATTNASGFFLFNNLVPGNYTLTEQLQAGYLNTSVMTINLTLTSGQILNVTSTYGVFGNALPATIFGKKYLDVNRNGIYDNGDTPLAGWTINLTNSTGLVGSVVTNASGQFLFSNLIPGLYTINEVLQPGYVNTSPTTYTLSVSSGKVLNLTSLVGAFGNVQSVATIIGLKYLDPNMNGTYDPGAIFVTRWGSSGSAKGSFDTLSGVCADPSGFIYVADTYNNRIQKFDSSGGFVTTWGSYGHANGSFSYPSGVCSDPSGFIYVADTNNNRIQKFSSSGGFVTAWGSFGSANGSFDWPYGVCSDPYGFIYVADTYNDRVQKFSSSGGFVTTWGSLGITNGSFFNPSGVCSDTVRLYIRGRHRQ